MSESDKTSRELATMRGTLFALAGRVSSSNRDAAAGEIGWSADALPAGVIRISLAQFARQPVCFLHFASLSICQGGFVQGARSDGGIIVKESDTFKCFAGVV